MATNLDSEFASTAQKLKLAQESVEDRAKRLQADDRSLIAKIIIGAFVFLMGWVVISVTAGAYLFEWDTISEPAKYLMAVLSSVMLPVVTLVIGYYFGSK